MNTATIANWYQANIQYLISSIDRISQILANYIERNQNPQNLTEKPLTPQHPKFSYNPPSALEQLCTTFGLSAGERDIILLCVGVEIDQNLGLLCSEAQGNSEINYPTLGLALAALPTASWSLLSAQNSLQYWKLIEIAETQILTQSPIKIDRRILCYLLGEPSLDSQLAGIVEPLPPSIPNFLADSHQKLAEKLTTTYSYSAANSTFPIVQLCGAELTAKYAIALAACKNLGWNLYRISANVLPLNSNELNQLMQRCLREAHLTRSALLIDGDDVNLADGIRESAISKFIEGLDIPLLLSTQQRMRQHLRPMITLDVNQPTHSEQRIIWQAHLGSVAGELNGDIDRLVSQFNLSTPAIQAACLSLNSIELKNLPEPEEKIAQVEQTLPPPVPNRQSKIKNPLAQRRVHEVSQKTLAQSKIEPCQSPIVKHLWNFCRTQARPQLEDLAQHIQASATWDDLILPEQQKNILRDISLHVRQRTKVYQEWGFAGKGGRGLGISALFSGASGTGKTMAAEVLAQELQLDLFRIDLSAVVSKYIGETEKNLRRIFDAAETGGAILLFDEADALFGKRTQVKDSHDRHANVEVSYLLQRMEAYQGLAILTTNLKESLDQAFLRRIRFALKFPFPDAAARTQIWQRIFPKETPTNKLEFNKLGSLNVAGGNIRNIALNAAFIAADAGEPVMMKHILLAAKSECVKLERSLTDVEIRGWV